MVEEIRARFRKRDSIKEIDPSEMKKLQSVVGELLQRGTPNPASSTMAFLDHVFPAGSEFIPVRNVYFEWRIFRDETLPALSQILPVTETDETLMEMALTDLAALAKRGTVYYKGFYADPGKIGEMKVGKIYRSSPDFYKLLSVLRFFQRDQRSPVHYPLFTIRSFLVAQVESLAGFLDRLIPGNITSFKAYERYEDWYCRKFYGDEMAKKAKSRPSENNPVCAPGSRVEYERTRMLSGARVGDLLLEGENPVKLGNVAAMESGKASVQEKNAEVVLPPAMRA